VQNAISSQIRQNNIDTVLQIRQVSKITQTVYGTPSGALSYKYQATLKNSEGKKFWTSIVELSPNLLLAGGMIGTNTKDLGALLAHDIVEKMLSDGILTHCPASNSSLSRS